MKEGLNTTEALHISTSGPEEVTYKDTAFWAGTEPVITLH